MPANNTITSNVTGTKAGNEFHGLTPKLTGQSGSGCPVFEPEFGHGPNQAQREADPRQTRWLEAHRLVEAVDRVRRVDIEDGIALLPNLPGDRKNVVLVLKDADHHAPAHLWCLLSARSCATTPFTSAIAIIGRMRQKIRKQVKKSPKLPNNVATSMLVGR